MKKVCRFISRNFQTMEKHVVPSSLGISNKNPMKRTVIRKHKNKKHASVSKHLFINKLLTYLFSDPYMYNPLVSPQPSFDFPTPKQIITSSPGILEDVALPIRGRSRKLMKKVVDFMEADCYLYSPLITDHEHVICSTAAASRSSGDEGGDLNRQIRSRPVARKTVAYHRESGEAKFTRN